VACRGVCDSCVCLSVCVCVCVCVDLQHTCSRHTAHRHSPRHTCATGHTSITGLTASCCSRCQTWPRAGPYWASIPAAGRSRPRQRCLMSWRPQRGATAAPTCGCALPEGACCAPRVQRAAAARADSMAWAVACPLHAVHAALNTTRARAHTHTHTHTRAFKRRPCVRRRAWRRCGAHTPRFMPAT
jgi:hypothetical protein